MPTPDSPRHLGLEPTGSVDQNPSVGGGLSDAELMQASVAGDRDAFSTFVKRHQNLVCAVAYSTTGDVALSEEVGQETSVVAWQKLGEISDPSRVRGWLAGTARNLARMALRKRKGEREAKLDPEALPAVSDSPLDALVSDEGRLLLWKALAAVPETYREPLVLFYRQERSVRQVAEGLGLSEDAVKQRLSRGRQHLKDELLAAVEQGLEATRPTRAFSVGVMAALGTREVGAMGGATKLSVAGGAVIVKAILAALVLACLVLAAYLFPRANGATESAAATEVTPGTVEAAPASPDEPRATKEGVELPRRPSAPPWQRRTLSKSARVELLLAIKSARARAVQSAHATGQAPARHPRTPPAAPLDIQNRTGSTEAWEGRQLEILNELLAECYALASHEVPDLVGTLGVRYSVKGEPGVGGLVTDIAFVDDYSTIEEPTMLECTRESLYALELDPPPEGVQVDRELTLRFGDGV